MFSLKAYVSVEKCFMRRERYGLDMLQVMRLMPLRANDFFCASRRLALKRKASLKRAFSDTCRKYVLCFLIGFFAYTLDPIYVFCGYVV